MHHEEPLLPPPASSDALELSDDALQAQITRIMGPLTSAKETQRVIEEVLVHEEEPAAVFIDDSKEEAALRE